MATTTVSAWGKPGAWALASEENEAELPPLPKAEDDEVADFPSLAAAAAAKTKKKKKPRALSIQEFNTAGVAKPVEAKGLTVDELLILPTGPRERSAEELDRGRLGGGFRSYGLGSRDEQPRRQGSFNRESNREFAPSRADETDNWATGKNSSFGNGFERRDRGERGGFSKDSQSRADEVDNWAMNKSFAPSEPRRYDRRVGFGLESNSGGADSDNWLKRKEEEGRKPGGAFDSLRERRGGFESNGANPGSWGRKREEVDVTARPRLNLQPRTLPVGDVQNTESSNGVKPKGSNPFGAARPREEVLKEKGQDWKEIDEKLDSLKMKEVVSVGSPDGKRTFWNGNRGREDRVMERAWRRPGSVDSRPQSAGESDNGVAETTEHGDA